MRYVVFSGAPTRGAVSGHTDSHDYTWRTLKTTVEPMDATSPLLAASGSSSVGQSMPLAPLDLERALANLHDRTLEISADSISLGVSELDQYDDYSSMSGDSSGELSMSQAGGLLSIDDSAISWAPTNPRKEPSDAHIKPVSAAAAEDDSSLTPDDSQPNPERTSFLTDMSRSLDHSTGSYDASIALFPNFTFNPAKVMSLASLPNKGSMPQPAAKVNILAGVLEVTGPETIPTKTGPVSLLQLVLGDGSGSVMRLAVWRKTAEQWAPAMRRGDVVHFSNLAVNPKGGLTASANNDSSIQVCYRVLPVVATDAQLRPDLRLAQTDSAVRQVAAVVRWVERMAGLS